MVENETNTLGEILYDEIFHKDVKYVNFFSLCTTRKKLILNVELINNNPQKWLSEIIDMILKSYTI